MATNLSTHEPIKMYETISGNTELTQNPPQAAGQTFLSGTPIELVAGFAEAWTGSVSTPTIYGVSLEAGGNYATAGEGYAANFGQQGPPWTSLSEGTAPNQPSSTVIPYGAPFITGGVLTMLAVQDTIFTAQTDTSEGATTITAGSVTAGVGTFTAANVHYAGEQVVLAGFTGAGAVLNGLTVTVLSTGLSTSQYEADTPGITTISSTGAGTDTPGPVTPTIASVGKQYGLTVDANGSWYIDFNKTTAGTNTAVIVIGLYPGDVLQSTPFAEVPNGKLLFQFLPSVVQI